MVKEVEESQIPIDIAQFEMIWIFIQTNPVSEAEFFLRPSMPPTDH